MKLLSLFKHKDLFDEIEGYEDEKWMFKQALESQKPIHILLVGPPGLAKTRFLKAIQKRFGDKSYFALASGSTGAGMVDYCFKNEPRYLCIDEIEDMRQNDQASLLSLLQDGVLVETKKTNTRAISFKCSVFATCNDTKRLKERMLTRFCVIRMKTYTEQEFKRITVELLKDNPLAEYIADNVYSSSVTPNIRDCERIAAMSKTEQDVLRILRTLK
jgi:MoxR-like ATPase